MRKFGDRRKDEERAGARTKMSKMDARNYVVGHVRLQYYIVLATFSFVSGLLCLILIAPGIFKETGTSKRKEVRIEPTEILIRAISWHEKKRFTLTVRNFSNRVLSIYGIEESCSTVNGCISHHTALPFEVGINQYKEFAIEYASPETADLSTKRIKTTIYTSLGNFDINIIVMFLGKTDKTYGRAEDNTEI